MMKGLQERTVFVAALLLPRYAIYFQFRITGPLLFKYGGDGPE